MVTTNFRKRLVLGALVTVLVAFTAVFLLSGPKDATAKKPATTTKAFQRAADSQGTRAPAEPRAIPAAAAAARALVGTAAFRQEVGNVARAAGLGSVARDVVGALFGFAATRTSSGPDVLLDGPAM